MISHPFIYRIIFTRRWMITRTEKSHIKKILEIDSQLKTSLWSEKSFLIEIENNYSYNLTSFHSSIINGYMFGWMIKNEYHLNKIVVCKKYRRIGIAKNMIEMVTNFPKLKRIYLEVSDKNVAANKLYKSIGFMTDGFRKKYYSDGSNAKLYKLEIR